MTRDGESGSNEAGPEPCHSMVSASQRLRFWLGAGLVLAVFAAAVPARLVRPGVTFGLAENVQIAEAQAWWNGRLDIPERKWDTAEIDGKFYSYFPPMFTILSAAVVPFFGGVPQVTIALMVLLVPLLAYLLFFRLAGSVLWGVVLALGLVLGTGALPVLRITLTGAKPYHVNHTLALIGLLLILVDYFGGRRIWPACIGLAVASLSRQMTFLFLLPVVVSAFQSGLPQARWRRLLLAVGTCAAVGALFLGLNTAKFGHPFRTGYMLIHEGRDDAIARDARAHGLFSPHWVPRNLYYANLGFPELHEVRVEGERRCYLRPNSMSAGIWWTTPLLMWLFIDGRRLVRDRRRVVLLVSAGAVYVLLLFWYTTGAEQRGFNRFSLDYMPALMAVLVPACLSGGRRWWTLGMIAWSVLYFRFFIAMPHLRVW